MSSDARILTFERTLNAAPKVVYRAWTNANSLRGWLCNQSQVDAREGGRLYLWWDSGYYAAGVFTTIERDKVIAFSWLGRDEPGPTNVRIKFRESSGGTLLTLEHADIGTGDAWEETRSELDKGWRIALENLQSVVETGEDLRILRRPLLGIIPGDEVDDELAARLGLPVTEGVVMSDVISGLGAEAAGMQKKDVLVELGGTPITGWSSIGTAVDPFYAGDKVEVVVYRGPERISMTMQLSKRPLPDVPASPGALAQAVEEVYAESNAALEEAVAGISESEAAFHPDAGEWSVREVLAHLVASERDTHGWIAGEVSGSEIAFNSNELVRLAAIISANPTIPDLLAALRSEQGLTMAMMRDLPESFLKESRGGYINLGRGLLQTHFHTNPHLDQIQEIVKAAREAQ